MELQINDLVESIKKDGIEKAKEEASKIIAKADEKAKEIVNSANDEASAILEEAKKQIEVFKENAKLSAIQAQRDAVLLFKKEVQSQLEKILSKEVSKAMDEEALAKLIALCVQDKDVSKLSVELASVSDSLKSKLADEIKQGLEIKPVKDVKAGFRVNLKDNSGFFDCTDEEIASMLAPFLGNLTI